jgi:hypothetical protein
MHLITAGSSKAIAHDVSAASTTSTAETKSCGASAESSLHAFSSGTVWHAEQRCHPLQMHKSQILLLRPRLPAPSALAMGPACGSWTAQPRAAWVQPRSQPPRSLLPARVAHAAPRQWGLRRRTPWMQLQPQASISC